MTAGPELNETDIHILNAISAWTWSGFYTPDAVDGMIDDILEEDAHENHLRAAVAVEFAKKQEAEKAWPHETDCDRLDAAFAALENRNILCLQMPVTRCLTVIRRHLRSSQINQGTSTTARILNVPWTAAG